MDNLEQLSSRQLTKIKTVANAHIKVTKAPYTIRKVQLLLRDLLVVKRINEIRVEKKKEALKKFYALPKEQRGKNIYEALRKVYGTE